MNYPTLPRTWHCALLALLTCCSPVTNTMLPEAGDTSPSEETSPSPVNQETPTQSAETPSPSGTPPTDFDSDGYDEGTDCDDLDSTINPGAQELCDGVDNDCDQVIDDGWSHTTYFLDVDGDGAGQDTQTIQACEVPEGYAEEGGDCDDGNAEVLPGALERCNGIDDDCDGGVDEGVLSYFYSDGDGDGYGSPSGEPAEACEAPPGTAAEPSDCDDANPDIHPGALEICDGIDQNCNGSTAGEPGSYFFDEDGDGYGADDAVPLEACESSDHYTLLKYDCDDTDPTRFPVLVSDERGSTGGDGTPFAPFSEIQNGVENSGACETVLVEPGLYLESVAILNRTDLKLIGLGGMEATAIQSAGGKRVILIQGGSDIELRGFSLEAVDPVADDGAGIAVSNVARISLTDLTLSESECTGDDLAGGGISLVGVTDAVISGALFNRNRAYYGGGVGVDRSSVSIYDSIFDGNIGTFLGGGVSQGDRNGATGTSELSIVRCIFRSNSAISIGGGLYTAYGHVSTVTDSLFEGNVCSGGNAGAVNNASSVVRSEFIENQATYGGAVYARDSATLTANIFWRNEASLFGGAVIISNNTNTESIVTFVNNTFADNRVTAGLGATFYIYDVDVLTLRNNIIVDLESRDDCVNNAEVLGTLILDYNNVYSVNGDAWGGLGLEEDQITGTDGNISEDPQFVSYDPAVYYRDGFRLMSTSPSLNSGNTIVGSDPDGSTTDMGAFGGSSGFP